MKSYPESTIYIRNSNGTFVEAPWSFSEGGQQGATVTLLTACAAIQPYLEELDAAVQPHQCSARKGIDDGVTHDSPEVIWPLMETN